MKNNNESHASSNTDYLKSGRYLYADYTPFEEDKNFIDMLRNFVIVSRDVTSLQDEVKELELVSGNAQRLHDEMASRIAQFRSSVHDTMDSFHKQYNEMTYSLRAAAPNSLFIGARDSLVSLLTETEQKFDQQSDDFKKYAGAKITECNKSASGKVESWLLNWHYMMPYALASKISNTATVSIDDKSGGSTYKASCENALIISTGAGHNSHAVAPPSMSYSFSIDTADLEFWNYKKRISDLGMQNISLPVGLKTPVSARLKKSFKLGLGDNDDQLAEKEPEFIDIGGYYIVFVKMESSKTLLVRLASDPSNPSDRVEMLFNLAAVQGSSRAGKAFEGGMPKIDYLSADGSKNCSDLLQIKEIAQHADVQKIMLVGRTLADKMKILLDADVVASRGQLSLVAANGKNAMQAGDSDLFYDAPAMILLLELLAGSFRPLVKKLKDKSPVAGELILKQQLEGGDRREYVVRTEELESMLLSTENGKRILGALGLSASTALDIPKTSLAS